MDVKETNDATQKTIEEKRKIASRLAAHFTEGSRVAVLRPDAENDTFHVVFALEREIGKNDIGFVSAQFAKQLMEIVYTADNCSNKSDALRVLNIATNGNKEALRL